MSENHSYTRFRREGRSGSDTYSRLYSRENCIPRPGAKPKIRSTSNMRDLLSHDKDKYLNGTPRPLKARTDNFGKKMRELYDKAPQPIRDAGEKMGETVGKVKAWKHFRRFVCIMLIVFSCVLCFFGVILTAGFNALSGRDMLYDMSVHYEALAGYSPYGNEPRAEDKFIVVTDADVSGADLSYSDTAAETAETSERGLVFVSQCDIPAKPGGGAQLKTAMRAGFNAIGTAGLDIELYVKAEAGTASLPATVFGKNGNRDIEYVVAPTQKQLSTVGCHTLRVRTKGKECNVLLVVDDTVAPTVTLHDVSIWLGDGVEASAFVDTAHEYSPMVVTFATSEPNLSLVGEQLVYINVKDIRGNACELLAARLNIAEDTEPPVISGARNRTVVIGESISYKQGVTVTDNRDKNVKLQVDSSAVKPTETGSYDVIYTATDENGNTTSVTVTFKFGTQAELDVDLDLENRVEKVAKKIFKAGMTDAEKAKAIYNWCRNNIGYSGHADKGDWKKAAIAGFKKRSGDCYTYFACAKALFEYCGIENIDVVKVRNSSSESRHYWSLVDVGTGYYHFDATPRVGGFNGFMRTDKQIKNYSSKNKNSHRFDASLYPATPEESFSA